MGLVNTSKTDGSCRAEGGEHDQYGVYTDPIEVEELSTERCILELKFKARMFNI